jgi:hypothetical protein
MYVSDSYTLKIGEIGLNNENAQVLVNLYHDIPKGISDILIIH